MKCNKCGGLVVDTGDAGLIRCDRCHYIVTRRGFPDYEETVRFLSEEDNRIELTKAMMGEFDRILNVDNQ